MPRLSDIVGQDQATDVLRRSTHAGKLAHAYLFTGPDGVGKATCARHLAAALNCLEHPREGCAGGAVQQNGRGDQTTDKPCISCHKIDNGLHPDLMEIAPDGAYIKIGQVRQLEEHLMFEPHEGRYRVVVIDGADQLNLNAANALLKSVEEPRPRTLFVLVASAGHRVVPTLVSRCQRIRFVPLEVGQVMAVVSTRSDAPERERRAAVALAEGSPKRALWLLSGEQMAFIQTTVGALLDAASRRDVLPLFEAAVEAGRDRKLLGEVLEVVRAWLRDVLLCHEGLGEGRVVNADQLDRLEREASRLSRAAILARLRAVNEAQAALRGNVHATLALENLVLQMKQATT
jgi:DNA polymerase-3 subunit delta'